MLNGISVLLFPRFMSTTTFVPLGPRSKSIIPRLLIPTPAMVSPSTRIILSPGRIPTASEGPPKIVSTINSVSCNRLKRTPMPSKLPIKGSFIAWTSLAAV